ncbi:MAG: PIN domain-containing protein [Opitutales bacterium]
MSVVVDTSVWSLLLRRKRPQDSPELDILRRLIRDKRATLLGIVKQELLSGFSRPESFERVVRALEEIPVVLATGPDHVAAAKLYTDCRRNGIQGSLPDLLVCTQSLRLGSPILTADKDFKRYASITPIRLVDTAKTSK